MDKREAYQNPKKYKGQPFKFS